MTAPAPCRPRVRYERAGPKLLLSHRSGRRQDDARSDRRGAAEWRESGGRIPAPVGERLWMRFRPRSARRMGFGIITALLTITPKSDYLRAVWDGDRL
jgi:hypothetical protein